MLNNFYECKTTSSIVDVMMNKVTSTESSSWSDFLDISLITLTVDDFVSEPNLVNIINKFDCHKKLAIYRYKPNFCYQWHVDSIRNTAINLQLTGTDSFCVFGEYSEARKLKNLERLTYKNDKYYLLNVTKYHTVFNFDNERYILSIGFPKPIVFDEVKDYLISNNI